MHLGAWHFSWHWNRSQCGKTAAQNALLAHGRDAGETLRLAMALAAGMRMAAAYQPLGESLPLSAKITKPMA